MQNMPQQKIRRYKEKTNENFRIIKYENQNKKLSGWFIAEWTGQRRKHNSSNIS